MPPPEPAAIEARGLRKTFGPRTAVDGVDLQVRRGEIFGLVGPDGAGKTTVMRILVGALDPDGGEAAVAGFDLKSRPEEARRALGYVSQRFSLYGDLTVAENLRFFAALARVPRAERRRREAELLGFARMEAARDRLAQDLSGGMRQKLALACTLIHRPQVLLLDEPTSGVDPVSRREFWRILSSLLLEGVTIFVSTPYMDEAERCSRVALMDRGRIRLCDTPAALRGMMEGEVLEVRAEPQRRAKELLSTLAGVRGIESFGDRLHLWVERASEAAARLAPLLAAEGIAVVQVRPVVPGLEDVFVSLLTAPRTPSPSAGGP